MTTPSETFGVLLINGGYRQGAAFWGEILFV